MPTTISELLEHKQIICGDTAGTFEYYKVAQNDDGTCDYLEIEVFGHPPSWRAENVPPGSEADIIYAQKNTRSKLLAEQFVHEIIKEHFLIDQKDIIIVGISKVKIYPSGLIKLTSNELIKPILHNMYPILKSIENLNSEQINTVKREVGECLLGKKPFFVVKQELNANYRLNIPFNNESSGLREIFIDIILKKIKWIIDQHPSPFIKELIDNSPITFKIIEIASIESNATSKAFNIVLDMMLYYHLLVIASEHIVISDQTNPVELQRLQLAKFHVINKRNQDQQKWCEFANFYIKTTLHLDIENDKDTIIRLFNQLLRYDDDLVRIANEKLSILLNQANSNTLPRSFNINDIKLKCEEWNIIIRLIRENAFERLNAKITSIPDNHRVMELLQFYRNKPLFNSHRSHGFLTFFSRIGRTASMVKIDDLIEKRQKSSVNHRIGNATP